MTRILSSFRLTVALTSLTCLLLAAGCSPLPAAAAGLTAETPAATVLTPELESTPGPIEIAEDFPKELAYDPSEGYHPAVLIPAVEDEPLHFTFPTPATDYITAWRPPLVPVPWAMSPYDHYYFVRPIAADSVNWPTADYRYGDLFPEKDIVHTGIDIAAERGTPVIAAADGKVTWAGEGLYKGIDSDDDPYGIAVAIRHDFGYDQREVYTIYAHMDRVDVKVGQRVETGDQVGIVGNTGQTTGPHLHFEVRIKDNTFFASRNPELWLAPPQGWGVLVGRLTGRYGFLLNTVKVYVTSLKTGDTWVVRTYGPTSVNSDDYYQENLVLSDLPAGDYRINFRVNWRDYQHTVTIQPGKTTFFNFNERPGVFSDQIPEKSSKTIFFPAWDEQFNTP